MSIETLKAKIEAEFKALVEKVESIFGKNNQVTQHIQDTASTVLEHVDTHASASTGDAAAVESAAPSSTAVGALNTGTDAAIVPGAGAADETKPLQDDAAAASAAEKAAGGGTTGDTEQQA